MKKVIFIFALFISLTHDTFAHQDFWVTNEFGNIKTRIKTGFMYEEIQKVNIIGALAKILCEKLDYSEPIFLDFKHFYVDQCDPDYFISFDNGILKNDYEKGEQILSKKGIVIRQVSNVFDPTISLELLEYAILNLKSIKSNQREIEYNENYCQWIFDTIDTVKIYELLKIPPSNIIREVLDNKIYRHEIDFKFGFTYYWENDSYTIVQRDLDGKETTIKKLDEIYDFRRVGNCIFAFPSVSDFYTINKKYGRRPEIISKKWTIENANLNYIPYKLEHIGGYKYSIYFFYNSNDGGWQPKRRTLIYDELVDELIKL